MIHNVLLAAFTDSDLARPHLCRDNWETPEKMSIHHVAWLPYSYRDITFSLNLLWYKWWNATRLGMQQPQTSNDTSCLTPSTVISICRLQTLRHSLRLFNIENSYRC